MRNYSTTYEEILSRIEKEHLSHSDVILASSDLFAWPNVEDHASYSTTANHYIFTGSALDQLLNKLKIPVRFYKRNPTKLQVAMFNHWNEQRKDTYMFRLRDKNVVRAVLTEKYGIMDDVEVFPTVIEEFRNYLTEPRWLHRDDQITQLAVNFTGIQTKYENDRYQAGVVITNSETGHSSVWIEPVVHMNHYTFYNRYILQKQYVPMRLVHRGKVDVEKIRPMINQAQEIAQVGIVQLIEASKENVSGSHLVTFVKSIDALTKRFKDILEEEWEEMERVNKLNAARRILECAAELPLFQRMNVEQQVGKLTGMFTGYKARMEGVIQELIELDG